MKNLHQEHLARRQHQFHQRHAWSLSREGLFIENAFIAEGATAPSWSDEVGFILNRRRVFVCWRHPRHQYRDAILEQASIEAGPGPDDDWFLDIATRQYRGVGASRKQLVTLTSRLPSDEQIAHEDRRHEIRQRLWSAGVELEVQAVWMRRRFVWATVVNLVAPLEVRNEGDLRQVAALAQGLLLGQRRLADEFPGYRYGREDWLDENIDFR